MGDRIFGTFQDLRPDEQTVYGLIDQPQFFNVVKHQLFYFTVLLGKVEGGPWWQKMAVWFLGPGWFPGLPRMGDNNLCPEIPQREKHFTNLPLLALSSLSSQSSSRPGSSAGSRRRRSRPSVVLASSLLS